MLDWINYKDANYPDFINQDSLYAIYQTGYPIQIAIWRTGHGLVNISGSWTLWEIEKIALINVPKD